MVPPTPPPPPEMYKTFDRDKDYIGIDAALLNNPAEFRPGYLESVEGKMGKWDMYTKAYGWGIEMIKTPELRDLVYDGIPDDYRGTLREVMCCVALWRC